MKRWFVPSGIAAAVLTVSGCGSNSHDLPTDVTAVTATDIATGVCGGTMNSVQITSDYLSRIGANAEHNAFVTVDATGAARAAAAADARRESGASCLPLQGVPIVVKDNIQVAGLPSTAGTPALRNFVPPADAPVVKKLRDAGAVILGKTNMHELAFGISGYNPAYNTSKSLVGVRNAYDLALAAGGSSAGTAVALGLRMAPAGLGTDTGGSVRIPCAFNGCASLRPTVGRYPQDGIAPISHTRDTAGPMAVSMADVELLDRVITGAGAVGAADLKGVRLGLVPDFLANLDADTRSAFDAAIAKLRAAGVTIVNVSMPNLATLNGNVGFPVALYEAYDDMVAYLARYNTGVTIDQLAAQIASPDVKATYTGLVIPRLLPTATGTTAGKPLYDAAIATYRPQLQQLYASTFSANQLDALVFPTTPHVAMKANPDSSSLENFGLYIQNTDPGGNAGVPGVQVPMGIGTNVKVPVGLEMDGPAGSDRRLVAIGIAVENVLGRVPAAK